jgi:hypothetical protein
LFVGLSFISISIASSARADIVTTNLLTNPGAETGNLTGWTVGGTSNPTVDNGTEDPGINPHSGSFDFFGNIGAEGTLSQDVSLVGNQGITAALIDSGNLTANVSFFEQGLNQGNPSDHARVILTFLDASSAVLGTFTTPVVDSHNSTWGNFTGSADILSGTRTIEYTMDFIRSQGSFNDSFVDDNVLTVTTPSATTPVPEPSGLIVFGLGVVSLVGVNWIRLRKSSAIVA